MALLEKNEIEQLKAWAAYEASKVTKMNPKILAEYVSKLVMRNATKENMISSLNDFMGPSTESFVEKLQQRLAQRDFTFQEEKTEPPKPTPPPPPEQKPTPAPVPAPKPKPTPAPKPKSATSDNTEQKIAKPKPTPKQEKPKDTKALVSSLYESFPDSSIPNSSRISKTKPQPKPTPPKPSKPERSIPSQPPSPKKIIHDYSQPPPPYQEEIESKPIKSKQDKWVDFNRHSAPKPRNRRPQQEAEAEAEDSFTSGIEKGEIEKPPRYVIFIAGIPPQLNSISQLFAKFTVYGKIIAIETLIDENVAFIEYENLLGAFLALKSNSKSPILKNQFLIMDYAIEPDHEELNAIQEEYDRRQKEKEKRKVLKNLNGENAYKFFEKLFQEYKEKNELMEKCTDQVEKEKLADEIASIKSKMDLITELQ
ncbi:hypothetical protein GPJ56_004735 [Histomonas meleagridis]|uniref:uncharacterized protein n=1 Tax=Histomonas meleagridis TaxID=135588 RepID=UPI0035597C9E|nr:hypothetical protein GPJ56_004735 [Histomonas meleagridis]KAH0799522.1 hypothetical protein GO595_007590 [Histomonas meleagridis]